MLKYKALVISHSNSIHVTEQTKNMQINSMTANIKVTTCEMSLAMLYKVNTGWFLELRLDLERLADVLPV